MKGESNIFDITVYLQLGASYGYLILIVHTKERYLTKGRPDAKG